METPKNPYAHYFLPGIYSEVADRYGVAAAERLAEVAGGRQRYFAATPRPWFVEALGLEGAHWLTNRLGNAMQKFSMGPVSAMAKRYAAIANLKSKGLTHQKIAIKFGLGDGSVYKILSRLRFMKPYITEIKFIIYSRACGIP